MNFCVTSSSLRFVGLLEHIREESGFPLINVIKDAKDRCLKKLSDPKTSKKSQGY